MVIAKLKRLNKEHMALFVVDKIPLVFQQGHVIAKETGLKVCCLCGENRTKKLVKEIVSGHFDVLVVTAGSLLELLKEQIQMELFCVMVLDECHHASADHPFALLLSAWRQCSLHTRPRLLGLTASPVQGATLKQVCFICCYLFLQAAHPLLCT